ncbi:MAG: orotidine-5'-phosphate decarboxylase [Actinobacteria bacterium]|nr:orotidine-5'-phosphate decarboxylase [Actinomycetota bacterium]
MPKTWIQKLENFEQQYQVCVGIDPIPEKMATYAPSLDLKDWCQLIVESTLNETNIYKFQIAYFEEWGIEGHIALKQILEFIQNKFPEKILIGDGKRSDIGSTAQAYANSMYSYWGFDVATINPYLGTDSILPFVYQRGALVICKTSNMSSKEIQNLQTKNEDKMIYQEVAEIVSKCNTEGNLGLVVGATFPDDMKKIRVADDKIPFLIPGLGHQEGDIELTLKSAQGNGFNMISSSRSILFPDKGLNEYHSLKYPEAIEQSLKKFKSEIIK